MLWEIIEMDDVETRTLLVPIPHYYIAVYCDYNTTNLGQLNREIRDWCIKELDVGSWETQFDHNDNKETVIGVYINMENPDHAMAVKLRWS